MMIQSDTRKLTEPSAASYINWLNVSRPRRIPQTDFALNIDPLADTFKSSTTKVIVLHKKNDTFNLKNMIKRAQKTTHMIHSCRGKGTSRSHS